MNGTTNLLLGTRTNSEALSLAHSAGFLSDKGTIVVKGVASRGGGTNRGVEVLIEVHDHERRSLRSRCDRHEGSIGQHGWLIYLEWNG